MKRTWLLIAALGFFLIIPPAYADWTPAKRLTWTSGQSDEAVIVVDSSGALHIAWNDLTPGNWEVYYRKSTDGGTTWAPSQRLTWTSGESIYPALAVDSSDNLHLVWSDEVSGNSDIYYRKSTNGGTSWTARQRVTQTSGGSYDPSLVVDSADKLHLVWDDDTPGNYEIYYKKITPEGDPSSGNQRLTWNSENSFCPVMAIDSSDHLHLAWWDDEPGNFEIYYRNSPDGGTHWSAKQRLTWSEAFSESPYIGIDTSGNPHIVWDEDTAGSYEIFHKKSTNGGAAWSAKQRLTWTSGNSYWAGLGFGSSSDVHVVWSDKTPGNFAVYYRRSTDGGASWTSVQRITWTSGWAEGPTIAVDPAGDLHLIWWDDTPGGGNWDIYYKKYTD